VERKRKGKARRWEPGQAEIVSFTEPDYHGGRKARTSHVRRFLFGELEAHLAGAVGLDDVDPEWHGDEQPRQPKVQDLRLLCCRFFGRRAFLRTWQSPLSRRHCRGVPAWFVHCGAPFTEHQAGHDDRNAREQE